jgi:hypothetical protein
VSDLSPEIKQAIREAYAKLAALPNFRTRRPQREMIALAGEAFASNRVDVPSSSLGVLLLVLMRQWPKRRWAYGLSEKSSIFFVV